MKTFLTSLFLTGFLAGFSLKAFSQPTNHAIVGTPTVAWESWEELQNTDLDSARILAGNLIESGFLEGTEEQRTRLKRWISDVDRASSNFFSDIIKNKIDSLIHKLAVTLEKSKAHEYTWTTSGEYQVNSVLPRSFLRRHVKLRSTFKINLDTLIVIRNITTSSESRHRQIQPEVEIKSDTVILSKLNPSSIQVRTLDHMFGGFMTGKKSVSVLDPDLYYVTTKENTWRQIAHFQNSSEALACAKMFSELFVLFTFHSGKENLSPPSNMAEVSKVEFNKVPILVEKVSTVRKKLPFPDRGRFSLTLNGKSVSTEDFSKLDADALRSKKWAAFQDGKRISESEFFKGVGRPGLEQSASNKESGTKTSTTIGAICFWGGAAATIAGFLLIPDTESDDCLIMSDGSPCPSQDEESDDSEIIIISGLSSMLIGLFIGFVSDDEPAAGFGDAYEALQSFYSHSE